MSQSNSRIITEKVVRNLNRTNSIYTIFVEFPSWNKTENDINFSISFDVQERMNNKEWIPKATS